MMRTERSREGGIRLDECNFEEFYSALPFSPTGAQRRAVSEAAADMRSGGVMNRLLQARPLSRRRSYGRRGKAGA